MKPLGLAIAVAVQVLLLPSAHAAAAAQTQRVLILDIQADGVSESEAAQLPDLIGHTVAGHPGYAVIPAAEAHRAIAARDAKQPGCGLSESCRAKVARELRAQIILFGTFAKRDRGYELSLVRTDSDGGQEHTSEKMRLLKSLSLNVKICLDRLFAWSDQPETSAATAIPPPAPPPAAKPSPAQSAPPSPPPAPPTERPSAAKTAPPSPPPAPPPAEAAISQSADEGPQDELPDSPPAEATSSARNPPPPAEATSPPKSAPPPAEATRAPRSVPPPAEAPARPKSAPPPVDEDEQAGEAAAASASSPDDGRPTLAVLGVRKGAGFDSEAATHVRDLIVKALQHSGPFHVLTDADLTALLGLARKKELAGSNGADAAPSANNGLGAQYLGAVDVSKVGKTTVVLFKILDVKQGLVVARRQESATTAEQLPRATARLVSGFLKEWPPSGAPVPTHVSADEAAPDPAFTEARQAEREGLESIPLYRKILARDATSAPAALRLAFLLRDSVLTEARADYQLAKLHRDRLAPTEVPLLEALEPAMNDPIDTGAFEKRLTIALLKQPADATLLTLLGMSHRRQNRLDDAIASFEQGEQADPGDARTFREHAWTELRRHNSAAALAAASRCLVSNPFALPCMRERERALSWEGEWREAAREARRMIAAAPTAVLPYEDLAAAQAALGVSEITVAATLARRLPLLAHDRSTTEGWDRANLALLSGDFAAGESELTALWKTGRALPDLSESMWPLYLLTELYQETERPEDAAALADREAERLESASPNGDDIWNPAGARAELTYARYRAGKATRADLKTARQGPLNRWRWQWQYAWNVASREEADEALAAFPEIVADPVKGEVGPRDSCAAGHVFALAGRSAVAIPLLERCTRGMGPLNWTVELQQCRLDLAQSYADVGKRAEARTTAQELIDRWPKANGKSRSVTGARALLTKLGGVKP